MSDKRSAPELSKHVKKARHSICLETKMEVIRRMESGQTRPYVCRSLNLPPSTVTTIMKNADKIKHCAQQSTAVSVKHVSYCRAEIFEKMEKLLSLWVDDANQKNVPLTQATITEKAKSIFDDLQQTYGGEDTFVGSKGWFRRFKSRRNCRSVKLGGEAVSADVAFPKEFQGYVEQGNYSPDLIFNVNETGLYWKKLPTRTINPREDRSAQGLKVAKDRLALLLGANVSGSLKLKPMLVYHSQTPRALNGLNKDLLPVYWRWNKKAWVTQDVFTDWYANYFCPTVFRFCEENNLPPKALLLLGNAPGRHKSLDEISTPLDVKVVYMPNTTTLLQPMDQGVIATFKALYLRNTFMGMMKVLDISDKTIEDYWRSFDILKGIEIIKSAWDEVSAKCLNRVWRELLPASLHDSEQVVHQENLLEDITQLARDVGFRDVRAGDVAELLQGHDKPLSNKDLEELYKELDREQSEMKRNEEEPPKVMKTADLKRILSTIESLTDELCELDDDWERSANVKRSIIASIRPYSEILKERKAFSDQQDKNTGIASQDIFIPEVILNPESTDTSSNEEVMGNEDITIENNCDDYEISQQVNDNSVKIKTEIIDSDISEQEASLNPESTEASSSKEMMDNEDIKIEHNCDDYEICHKVNENSVVTEKNSRKCYTTAEKLLVIEYAETYGNRAASRHFSMNESNVRFWRKNKEPKQVLPDKKKASRDHRASFLDLESALMKWVTERKEMGFPVQRKDIKLKALKLKSSLGTEDFVASYGWAVRFMKRHGLEDEDEENSESSQS